MDEKAFSFCAAAHTVNTHKPAPSSFPKPWFILSNKLIQYSEIYFEILKRKRFNT